MPENKVNLIFRAIADPTRREIFHVLVVASTALTISQISDQFEMSRQGVTKHIKILEDAGMVKMHVDGRERMCFADPKPLKEVKTWIDAYDQFWDDKLDLLGKYLDES